MMAGMLPGGAISNLYAVAVARFKAEPRSKQQGMTSLSSRLVMFTSEHVSNDVIRYARLRTVQILPVDGVSRFTFSISSSLRISLQSPTFGLRPPKVKSFFFVWTQRFAECFAESKLRTERSLKLINSPVDFACTRSVNQLEIKF